MLNALSRKILVRPAHRTSKIKTILIWLIRIISWWGALHSKASTLTPKIRAKKYRGCRMGSQHMRIIQVIIKEINHNLQAVHSKTQVKCVEITWCQAKQTILSLHRTSASSCSKRALVAVCTLLRTMNTATRSTWRASTQPTLAKARELMVLINLLKIIITLHHLTWANMTAII